MSELHKALLGYYRESDPSMPPYLRAAYCIKAAIVNELLTAHDPVPSTTSLSSIFEINKMTVSKSLQELSRSGLIARMRGKSYAVVDGAFDIVNESIEHEIRSTNLRFLINTMQHFKITKTTLNRWLREADNEQSDSTG